MEPYTQAKEGDIYFYNKARTKVLWWLGYKKLSPYTVQAPSWVFVFISILFILFSLPNGRLCYGEARAETVTSFRPYDLVNQPSNAYICQPNAYTYRPIDRSNDDPSTDRTSLYRTLAPYCYLNSPFWQTLSYVYYKERNRLILRLVLYTGCEEQPRLILSCISFENEITRTTNAGITLLLTTDRADMHTIYILDNSSAAIPTTT